MATAQHSRMPAAARRHALVQAAARVIAQAGAGSVSVRTIAAEAGVSAGLVGHHFAGIEDLLAATYRDVSARVAAALGEARDAAATPRAQLTAYLAASFAPPVMDGDLLATWLGLLGLTRSMPALAAAHAEGYAAYRETVAALLAACGTPGDPRLAAVALTALIDGLWLELCLDDGVFTPAEAEAIAARWVAALLGHEEP